MAHQELMKSITTRTPFLIDLYYMVVFVSISKEKRIFSYNLFCNLNIKDMKLVEKNISKICCTSIKFRRAVRVRAGVDFINILVQSANALVVILGASRRRSVSPTKLRPTRKYTQRLCCTPYASKIGVNLLAQRLRVKCW
jgi:hypothetical protein